MTETVLEDRRDTLPAGEPLLVIETHLSAEQYEKAMRYRHTLRLMKLVAIALGAYILANFGIVLYFWLVHGEPFAEVFRIVFGSRNDHSVYYFLGAVVLWCVFSIWYYPRRYRKYLVDVYGDQTDWSYKYSLYDDVFVSETSTEKASSDVHVRYADIKRIKTVRHSILLKTKKRTSYWIARDNLSAEEETKLLNVLRSHCVNAKQQPV